MPILKAKLSLLLLVLSLISASIAFSQPSLVIKQQSNGNFSTALISAPTGSYFIKQLNNKYLSIQVYENIDIKQKKEKIPKKFL